MYPIPIVVLFFNQPKRLQSLLTMISTIEPKTLILIQNGPNTVEDVPKVYACQEVIKSFSWKGKVITEFLPKKVDHAAFISSSITMAFRFVESAIILKEEEMPTAAFFEYMSFMAEAYENNPLVHIISGTTRLHMLDDLPYYFSRYPSTSGFLTFKRAIENFSLEVVEQYPQNKQIISSLINNKMSFRFFNERMNECLHHLQENQNPDNWSYVLTYYLLMNKGLTIIPKTNLVSHPRNPITGKFELSNLIIREVEIDSEFEKQYLKTYFKKKKVMQRIFRRKIKYPEV